MPFIRSFSSNLFNTAVSLIVLFHFIQPLVAQENDGHWDDRFYTTTFLDVFRMMSAFPSLAATDDRFYLAGHISFAGKRPVPNIASWDGRFWSELPEPVRTSYSPTAFYRGFRVILPRGNELFVGGVGLTGAGSIELKNIGHWDGTAWSDLGGGIEGDVCTMLIEGDLLYAGGSFQNAGGVSTQNIAVWNGSEWKPLGDGLPFRVLTLIRHNGDLIAGGSIRSVRPDLSSDPKGFNGIARWDGTEWHPIGGGVGGIPWSYLASGAQVRTMLSQGSNLYIGGAFQTAGGANAINVARWDGTEWHPMGEGLYWLNSIGVVTALLPREQGILAAGHFSNSGSSEISGLALWDAQQWNPVPDHPFLNVTAITARGSELFALGGMLDRLMHSGIAHFDGTNWTVLGQGFDHQTPSRFNAHLATDDGLLVAGHFPRLPHSSANVSLWNGQTWQPMPSVVALSGANDEILALARQGERIWFGGNFEPPPGFSNRFITSLEGTNWFTPGHGLSNNVETIAVNGSQVLAGGAFGLAVWNGSQWGSLGSGPDMSVTAIAPDGEIIYAAGFPFGSPFGTPTQIQRWDGTRWTSIASDLDGPVKRLVVHGNKLVAAGRFTTISGLAINRIGVWESNQWTPLGNGLTDRGDEHVYTITTDNRGTWFVGGSFLETGGLANLARLRDGKWEAMPGGSPDLGGVTSLAWWRGSLHAAGQFLNVGTTPSVRYGIWHDHNARLDLTLDGPIAAPLDTDFTMTLVAENLTTNPIANATIALPLPPSLRATAASNGASLSTDLVAWSLAELPPGKTQLSCTLSALAAGTLMLRQASVGAADLPPVSAPPISITIDDANPAPLVELITPRSSTKFNSPADIELLAEATDLNGQIERVEFFAGTNLVGSVSRAPYEFAWRNVSDGNYSLRAAAYDSAGKVTWSLPARVSVLFLPPNDNFENATLIDGTDFHQNVDTSNATAETGEPAHAGPPARASLWWKWIAPMTGRVVLTNETSIRLSFYSGDTLATLQPVPRIQDPTLPPGSSEFDVTSGMAYYIAIDTGQKPTGAFTLSFLSQGGRIHTVSLTESGDLKLDFIGLNNAEYILEQSLDLTTWTPIFTNQVVNRQLIFEIKPEPDSEAQFWRTRFLR